MREWRCKNRTCKRVLMELEVQEGKVLISKICPKCGTLNVELFCVETTPARLESGGCNTTCSGTW
jgi:phage FluMu protein Com